MDVPPEFDAQTTDTQIIEGNDNTTMDGQVPHDIVTTPRQTNVTRDATIPDDTDGSITSDGIPDLPASTKDRVWTDDEDTTGFRRVHFRLYDEVTIWMQQEHVSNHPFYRKWQRAIFQGLDALTKWPRVAKLFTLTSLQEYIVLMNECPRVQERYELTWDFFENTVSYKELVLPDTEDVLRDISKLNTLQRKMQQMAFKFDSCMQQYNTRLSDADTHITGCELKIVDQLNRTTSQLAATATKHYNSLSTYVTMTYEKFQSTLNEYTAAQQSTLTNMYADHQLKVQQVFREVERNFNDRLDQAIERAVQEILSTADEATDNINAQAEHIIQQAKSSSATSWKTAEPKPSKLFPNVDTTQFASAQKYSS
jgi:molecular chaperone GrpE (heat shock protein)